MSILSFRMRVNCILAVLLLTALLGACAEASLSQPEAGLVNPAASANSPETAVSATQPEAGLMKPASLSNSLAPAGTAGNGLTIQIDPALASSAVIETQPATPATTESPYWQAAPEFRQVTLSGYPVTDHTFQPQIMVYPVDEFKSANPAAAQVIDRLQNMLQSPQETQEMPFLPLINAKQMMHVNPKNLDFQDGQGIRYLTQFSQGIVPVNNRELIYTYQGLTRDGKYYVAATLPVTHASLPADEKITENELEKLASKYPQYLADLINNLNGQSADTFTPDLNKLDGMINSLEVQQPTEASVSQETSEPAATAEQPALESTAIQFSLDSSGLASEIQSETVAAVPASDSAPAWEVMPEYTRLTLQGYPITNHLMQPQIFIYPVSKLVKMNETAAKMVASLETLLQSPQEIQEMPFLPLSNTRQALHTHLQYLEPQNGQGLRYLTQFSQGIVPVNNRELIYTYQGLTRDGKYYVAAVLPVTHELLPADEKITGNELEKLANNYPQYLADLAQTLNVQAPDTFSPDLTKLDAMMSSLEIR